MVSHAQPQSQFQTQPSSCSPLVPAAAAEKAWPPPAVVDRGQSSVLSGRAGLERDIWIGTYADRYFGAAAGMLAGFRSDPAARRKWLPGLLLAVDEVVAGEVGRFAADTDSLKFLRATAPGVAAEPEQNLGYYFVNAQLVLKKAGSDLELTDLIAQWQSAAIPDSASKGEFA